MNGPVEVSGYAGSDLSRSLVDAAAEVIAARNRRAWTHSDDVQYRLEASDVLTVTLRLLADAGAAVEDYEGDWQDMLRRLAGEIREARDE